jgi:hypothetical protein
MQTGIDPYDSTPSPEIHSVSPTFASMLLAIIAV